MVNRGRKHCSNRREELTEVVEAWSQLRGKIPIAPEVKKEMNQMLNESEKRIFPFKFRKPYLQKAFYFVGFSGLLLIVVGLLFSRVGAKERDRFAQFLNQCGIVGLTENKIIHLKSSPALSSDYQERVFFAVVQIERQSYDQFLRGNGFVKDPPLKLPVKGAGNIEIPTWWDISPTNDQTPRYNKTIGGKEVMVWWSDGFVYLYGLG